MEKKFTIQTTITVCQSIITTYPIVAQNQPNQAMFMFNPKNDYIKWQYIQFIIKKIFMT